MLQVMKDHRLPQTTEIEVCVAEWKGEPEEGEARRMSNMPQ